MHRLSGLSEPYKHCHKINDVFVTVEHGWLFSNLFHQAIYALSRLMSENGIHLLWENHYDSNNSMKIREKTLSKTKSVSISPKGLSLSTSNSISVIFIVLFVLLLISFLVLFCEIFFNFLMSKNTPILFVNQTFKME